MENAEEILNFLEEFSKRKPKTIPQELNEYLAHVARTGDPVYQWSVVKALFKEKLLNVITDFYETTPGLDIPSYPNVDPFNYDIMKNSLIERLDAFTAAPFTVQRICELLTFPRKQYNRIDKFMRAIEKNILVVSTREPGPQRHTEYENGDPLEPMVNGSDNNSEYNVDVEMEDMSWKENAIHRQKTEPQPSSSDAHINVDDNESRLQSKQDPPTDELQDKPSTEFESMTPAESIVSEEQAPEPKTSVDNATETATPSNTSTAIEDDKMNTPSIPPETDHPKMDVESNIESATSAPLVIPEITVDDAEMTEQKLIKQASMETSEEKAADISIEAAPLEVETVTEQKEEPLPEIHPQTTDDSSSDSNKEELNEPKLISEMLTSSEESSSSSDITEGNSNSPKHDSEPTTDAESPLVTQEDSNHPSEKVPEEPPQIEPEVSKELVVKDAATDVTLVEEKIKIDESAIKSENYSISDVSSELPQSSGGGDVPCKSPEQPPLAETKVEIPPVTESKLEEPQSTAEVESEKEESQ